MVNVVYVRDGSGNHPRSVNVQRHHNRRWLVFITRLSHPAHFPLPPSLRFSPPPGQLPSPRTPRSYLTQNTAFTMGFLSFLRRAPANRATDVEKQLEQNDGQHTAPAKGFLPNLCSILCSPTTAAESRVEGQQGKQKPKDKPPKYNRHNLPSMVIEDPPPWVTNHSRLERRSDGTFVVTSSSQAEPKPVTPLDNLAE